MLPATTRRFAAGLIVAVLGLVLAMALMPYASGLLGAPMLYVIWEPTQRRLVRRMPAPLAAAIIILLSTLLLVIPGTWLVGMLVGQAQGAIRGVLASPFLSQLEQFRIGTMEVGPYLASAGQNVLGWVGGNALTVLGTATRIVLSLIFAFFGLYYLLIRPGKAWAVVEPYIPFSAVRSRVLRERFTAITISTVIGTGMIAAVQGTMLGLAFLVLGVKNAVFWGAVTAVLAILPLVGSGMVFLPAAAGLFFTGHPGKAIALGLWGLLVIGNVDNVLRPLIYNRYARIHPMVTLVGAIVGVEQMGFVGLILGPLAISYFFELVKMYCEEYVDGPPATVIASEAPPVIASEATQSPPVARAEPEATS